MVYVVEMGDGIDKGEVHEFHASSQSNLKAKVKEWMGDDGRFSEADIFSYDGNYKFTVYL